jgi:hypothetical protein
MKHLEELKESIKRELEKFAKQGDVSVGTLEKIHKLSDTYKNLCKIEMLEEESEGGYSEARGGRTRSSYAMGGSSYDDDMMYSERRGRGRNAKRDSMGRYSSDGGYEGGYSRHDAKDWMMSQLGEMMEDADPKEREALKECMRAIERA